MPHALHTAPHLAAPLPAHPGPGCRPLTSYDRATYVLLLAILVPDLSLLTRRAGLTYLLTSYYYSPGVLEEGGELDYHTLTTCYLPLTYYPPGVLEEGGELDYHTLTTCY